MAGDAYTGLRRRKQTPWSVTFGDALASKIIAVGGIGTIAAILLVVLVLLATALPLINSPSFEPWHSLPSPSYEHVGVDENGLLMWGMTTSGSIEVRNLVDGALVATYPGPEKSSDGDVSLSCSTISIDRSTLSAGFSDGSFRVARLVFETRLLAPDGLPEGVFVARESPLATLGDAIYQWIDASGVRQTRLEPIEWSLPRKLGQAPVVALDYLPDGSSNRLSQSSKDFVLAVVGDELVFASIFSKKNMMTRKVTETLEKQSCPLQQRSERPLSVMLINGTDHAIVAWSNGTLDRFSLAAAQPALMESQSAVMDGSELTCVSPLLARQNLLCGLEDGSLQGWMVIRKETPDSDSLDDFRLVMAHDIQVSDKALVSVASSEQTHVAATCDTAGRAQLIYVTTGNLLSSQQSPIETGIRAICLNPSEDTLVATSDDRLALARFDIGHPEASFKKFFGRIWYEGHQKPKYIWQSTSGTEKSETKLSLVPLVFGTFKATVYAMIISVPLAILAAIYTSEFLSPRARGLIKPVIELMASLPSVVLGYIAAMVIGPYLQAHLLAVLLSMLIVPLSFILAGHLWNLLPVDLSVRLQGWRLPGMAVCFPLAILLAASLAPPIEAALFGGSLIQWLGSNVGSPIGGWIILLTPICIAATAFLLLGTKLAELSRAAAIKRTAGGFAFFSLIRLLLVGGGVACLVWGISAGLSSAGFDLRGTFFDSYQDRNALLVGVALGFCIIPIIYTISDDAMQAVPASLRSASLACGATLWQTTVRVVIPSAMSGLFSAIMIGLGRAVGETMVVLMAAGNTPVMEWNPFNGFRTLSATLATELPEAAKGSTHFRTLFLAALLLFFLTLVANTLAEFVRIRFRKRASQL